MKSDSHLYAELLTRSARFARASAAASHRQEIAVTSLSLCSLFPQASPDVDEEGFSLRPGDEGDDILFGEEQRR